MMTRGQTSKHITATDNEDSQSESELDNTEINIGANSSATQPLPNVNQEAIASLVSSIAALTASVQELRNETSKSQLEVQQLRQRMERDFIHTAASETQPPAGQLPQTELQLPPPATQLTQTALQLVPPVAQPPATQLTQTELQLPPPGVQPPPNTQLPHNELQLPLSVVQPPTSLPRRAFQFVEGSAAKLYPLPTFEGNPEDWPLFFANFTDTTAEFGYNNRQNLMRLQKALQGSAKRSVTSMLIYPDDVPKVMKELEFNFGRHDLLIRAQLQKVQQFPAINDNRLDHILEFANRVRNISAFFKSAKCEHHLMNPSLLEQLISKLPPSKQFEWSRYAANIVPFPTVETFANWLSDLAKVVSIMPGVADISLRQPSSSWRQSTNSNRQAHSSQGGQTRRVLHTSEEQVKCPCCSQSHIISSCGKFKSLDCAGKWSLVKQQRMCFGCLQKGHGLSNCRRRKKCTINGCGRMHHPILHEQSRSFSETTTTTTTEPTADREHILNCRSGCESSLFKILPVILSGPQGSVEVYAMYDEGSSVSLIEDEVAIQLGLRGRANTLTLQWYGDSQTTESSRMVACDIRGVCNRQSYHITNLRTIKRLNLPKQSFDKSVHSHINALPAQNYVHVQPVLLLGLDNCHLSVPIQTVAARHDQPVAINTKLGWVVYGPVREGVSTTPNILHIRQSNALSQLNKLVEEYFSIEHFGVNCNTALESDDNQRARKILAATTKDLGQRYEVGLLWREERVNLPSSYAMAKQRLLNTESRMLRDSDYAERYKREMEKYLDKGYAKLITPDEAAREGPTTWYLPHFGVVNPHKPNKLRIVFDAAAATNATSLNSVLLKGPEQAQPLIAIIHKFRQGVVAVAGDIEEMFSQVRIKESDQDAQRFLWRNGDQNQPIQTYKMQTMIFGAICSPCCAEHIKNINAAKFKSTMPRGMRAVIESTYVDDLVISFNSAEEAITVTKEAITINAAAGFKLRSFVSNNKYVEQNLNDGVAAGNGVVTMERQATMEKILGMFWNTANDGLEFNFRFHKITNDVLDGTRAPTKRELLAIAMSMFDPFGLLANITISLKLLVQSLWKLHIQWDEPIPYQLAEQWFQWWKNIHSVKRISVPRCYSELLPAADDIQLHIFVDASSCAYAAVAYLRIRKGRKVDVTLVCAKSRCAPLKGMTIPRLELQAAVLGCRLKESLERCHDFRVNSTTFWSDSKTAILWIRSTDRDYKQFVAFRVAEILSVTSAKQWRWIPTTLNVADEATRLQTSFECETKSRWFMGTEFLHQDESCWPQQMSELSSDHCALEESTKRVMMLSKSEKYPIYFTNFSSFLKIIRTVAWVFRFCHNAKVGSSRRGELTADELTHAENVVLQKVQSEAFADEISAIQQNNCLPKSSTIYQLTPFFDVDGLLKVNGRIDAAYCLPLSARRPVILPHHHHVTRLIVKHYHCRFHHQNDCLTINEMRQKYWVSRARALLKSVKRECPMCIFNNAKPVTPLMGQLPIDRLTPYVRPFSYAGVDYCGPFFVAIGRRREKRWVALFTCLTTRAVHLEIADELSTDAFILCLRNFVNRRGVPIRLRSDNGTNFVGAQKELTQEERLFDFRHIEGEMAQRNIEWVFNCPANPSAGGCWERLVQCVKRLFQRVLKEEAPRLETFRSVLIEAENIINSRPLTELPVTPHEEEPLTPNHFLLGCLNSTQTPSPDEEKTCLRKQWRIAQNLKDRLWKRWTVEYLPRLLRRSKWTAETKPLQPGQLVIVCDSARPRSQWERGRITKVFVAKDGQVRTAEIRTSSGVLRRPASKLAALELVNPLENSPGSGMSLHSTDM